MKTLHAQLAFIGERIEATRLIASADDVTAHSRHAAAEDLPRLSRQFVALETAIAENQEAAADIGAWIERLETADHKSRHRALVVGKLEEAQDRLLRELGDEPVGTSNIERPTSNIE